MAYQLNFHFCSRGSQLEGFGGAGDGQLCAHEARTRSAWAWTYAAAAAKSIAVYIATPVTVTPVLDLLEAERRSPMVSIHDDDAAGLLDEVERYGERARIAEAVEHGVRPLVARLDEDSDDVLRGAIECRVGTPIERARVEATKSVATRRLGCASAAMPVVSSPLVLAPSMAAVLSCSSPARQSGRAAVATGSISYAASGETPGATAVRALAGRLNASAMAPAKCDPRLTSWSHRLARPRLQ